MPRLPLTEKQVKTAYIVAIVADLIQIPATVASFTGILLLPGHTIVVIVDCIAMIATILLLGFHWLLLPSLLIELIPGLTAIPTWTGCVAYVIKLRREEQALPPPLPPTADVQEGGFDGAATTPPPMLPASPPPLGGALERLKGLIELLEQNFISQEEYEAKRQQILAEL